MPSSRQSAIGRFARIVSIFIHPFFPSEHITGCAGKESPFVSIIHFAALKHAFAQNFGQRAHILFIHGRQANGCKSDWRDDTARKSGLPVSPAAISFAVRLAQWSISLSVTACRGTLPSVAMTPGFTRAISAISHGRKNVISSFVGGRLLRRPVEPVFVGRIFDDV